jgi:UPF0716 protein FxsA
MTRLLLGLAFIALPICELALLIRTGQKIGLWPTLGLVVAAALIGSAIMARQGLTVAHKTQAAIAAGQPPVGPVLDGACLLMAGALLISPGFITDVFALALLIPPIRHRVARWCVHRLAEQAHGTIQVRETDNRGARGPTGPETSGGPVIEGEFERLGEKARTPHPGRDIDRL